MGWLFWGNSFPSTDLGGRGQFGRANERSAGHGSTYEITKGPGENQQRLCETGFQSVSRSVPDMQNARSQQAKRETPCEGTAWQAALTNNHV